MADPGALRRRAAAARRVRRPPEKVLDQLPALRQRVEWLAADATGRRPVFGHAERLQRDPDWRDQLLFHEYFHGDTGAGVGASHQTGWTALVADLITSRRFPTFVAAHRA